MIRPWYRSRLFLLGLFTLGFLIWAWKDSVTKATWISHSGLSLNLRGCSLSVGMRFNDGGEKLRWARWKRVESPPSAPIQFTRRGDGGFLRLSFPFVLVSYLVAWTGLIFWWQRRKARLLKLHFAAPP
jgi:hypothetical protein